MKSIRKISILGVGFMGGSLALAIKKKFPHTFIAGYARSEASHKKLLRLKIVDRVEKDLAKCINDCDLVILASPIFSIIEYFKKISPFLKKGSIVIDLGSTKSLITKEAGKYLPRSVDFIGCHPLCGSDKSGAEFSNADLYKDSICLISANKSSKALKTVESLWRQIGAKTVLVDSALHDKMLSSVSHLPHVISFSLTDSVPDNFLNFSVTSMKDLTRISNSPAEVWADIFVSNRTNLVQDIKKYVKILDNFRKLIQQGEKSKIIKLITKINNKQKKISGLR